MAIGAHPDDVEIGLGGTIHRLLGQGHRVVVVDLMDGEETPYGTRERRQRETAKANAALGITERRCLDLPNRVLMDSEDARRRLAVVMRETRPDVVFTHWEVDAHPDHVAAFQITRGAMLLSRIVKIDLPHAPWRPGPMYSFLTSHLRHPYQPAFTLELSDEDFAAKLAAVLAYESQFVEGRPENWCRETLTYRARYYGSLGRSTFAEAVMSLEPPAVRDLFDLVGEGKENRPKP
jgi:bacillithiol biosynthesis deacetylase BshB1